MVAAPCMGESTVVASVHRQECFPFWREPRLWARHWAPAMRPSPGLPSEERVRAGDADGATSGRTTSVRGAPARDRGAAGPPELARQYDKLACAKKNKVLEYAQRVVDSCGPPPCARGADGLLEITITEEARATLDELQDSISVVMPEAGAFATVLNRRGPRACRVPPDESFRVRMHDGAIVAELHRNEIPEELATGWSDVEMHHKEHADMWGLGCEAEPTTNLERTAAAFKNAKGAAAYRIQQGMTVHSFGPRGGHVGNKLNVTYTNREGRTVKNFGIGGCPIERHKYSSDIFERVAPRGAQLLRSLVCSYEQRVVSFMESKGFPTQVSTHYTSTTHTCPIAFPPLPHPLALLSSR